MTVDEIIGRTGYTRRQLICIALVNAAMEEASLREQEERKGRKDKSEHHNDMMEAFRALWLDMVEQEGVTA